MMGWDTVVGCVWWAGLGRPPSEWGLRGPPLVVVRSETDTQREPPTVQTPTPPGRTGMAEGPKEGVRGPPVEHMAFPTPTPSSTRLDLLSHCTLTGPLTIAHSDPWWVRRCFGCVKGAPG